MGIVYVVQEQLRFDVESGKNVPRFPSIDRARELGKIVYMLEPNAHPFVPNNVTGILHHHLSNFCDEDYLILVGNPVLLGMATAIAANYNSGRVNFLQWSQKGDRYTLITAEIF